MPSACEASGKTIAEYAAEHGLAAQAMYAGKKILARKGVLPRTRPARFQRAQVAEPVVCPVIKPRPYPAATTRHRRSCTKFGIFPKGHDQCEATPDTLDLDIDQVYFNNFLCSTPFTGSEKIVPPPNYASGQKQWISTDFSLQLSISLSQWQEWHRTLPENARASQSACSRACCPER
ncbi:MAG TPA: hypothetical protein ENJ79_09890 [Gammaproteobacteria bacterium]|nr:hypothetical protein [Gammaproteobacteria bacterium]